MIMVHAYVGRQAIFRIWRYTKWSNLIVDTELTQWWRGDLAIIVA